MNKKLQIFNRFEFKYLIGIKKYTEFKRDLELYAKHDFFSFQNKHKSYTVASIYFDSLDYRFYWEKIDGEEERTKLRIRKYDNGAYFLEIKEKRNNIVLKKRSKINKARIKKLTMDEILQSVDGGMKSTLSLDVQYLLNRYDLKPKLYIVYEREAYESIFEDKLRITFDKLLRGRRVAKLDFEDKSNLLLQPANTFILEIKFNQKMPYWLMRLIEKHHLYMQRVSKYCCGVDRLIDV